MPFSIPVLSWKIDNYRVSVSPDLRHFLPKRKSQWKKYWWSFCSSKKISPTPCSFSFDLVFSWDAFNKRLSSAIVLWFWSELGIGWVHIQTRHSHWNIFFIAIARIDPNLSRCIRAAKLSWVFSSGSVVLKLFGVQKTSHKSDSRKSDLGISRIKFRVQSCQIPLFHCA